MDKTQSYLMQKLLDLMTAIQHFEIQIDDIYKINYYLIRKFKNDLLKEFEIEEKETVESCELWAKLFDPDNFSLKESLEFIEISNKIRDIMQEEMPDPWYSYSLCQLKNIKKDQND